MKKIFLFLIFLVLTFSFFNLNAQNFKIIDRLRVDLNEVEDIKKGDLEYTILTKDAIYTLDLEGKIINSIPRDKILAISFDQNRNKFYSIEDENNFDNDNQKLKYLTMNNSNSYSCNIIGSETKMSYSSSIVFLNGNKIEKSFKYIVGIPSGLYCNDKYLWYLYDKSVKGKHGFLMKYDIETGDLVIDEEIPVEDPKGIDMDKDGNLYTFNTSTNEIIKFRRDE